MAGGPKSIRLVVVPYDAGQRGVRMGAGPQALAAGGAARLRAAGYAVEEQVVEPLSAWRSDSIRPIPTRAGFSTGRAWRWWSAAAGALTSSVPGFVPLPEDHVLLVGARSFDDAEYRALRQSGIGWVPAAGARRAGPLADALGRLARRVNAVHFHLDLDVHDPSITPANEYAAPDGLSAEDVQRALRQTAERMPVVSACLAAYDPAFDPSAILRGTALAIINLFAAVATAA